MVTEELVRNNMQRSRMLVEGSLSYDGFIWNLEPNDAKHTAKHIGIAA